MPDFQAMVHELAYADCPKSYVFRGSKGYQPKQIADMLGLNPSSRPMQAPRPGQPMPAPAASKFLMPAQACEFQLTSILEGLQRDPWPVEQDKRPLRCTGVALGRRRIASRGKASAILCHEFKRFLGLTLSQAAFPNTGARIMLFAGGPATDGPGLVVGPELREPIRSHHDIDRDSVKHFKRATKVSDSYSRGYANDD